MTLDEKISAVTKLLSHASDDAISSAMIKLAGAGLAFPPGIDPTNAAKVYKFALRGVPLEALKRVVVRIVQGEIEGVSNFLPTAPALAALVKAEARGLFADRERLMAIRNEQQLRLPAPVRTEEAKARVREAVQGVKDRALALRIERREHLYDKPEEDLNRLFRNKLPPEPKPPAGKWSDQKWFQQQEENGNGENPKSSFEHDDNGQDRGGPEGQSERPFGFEDD